MLHQNAVEDRTKVWVCGHAEQSEMNITKLDLREPPFVHTKMFDQ